MALNTPIQGSAADLIKWAMIRMQQKITVAKLPLKMLLQVHDELVFECPKDEAEKMLDIVVQIMEDRTSLAVPFTVALEVDAKIGSNWLEAH